MKHVSFSPSSHGKAHRTCAKQGPDAMIDTGEIACFRQETRAWLEENCPKSMRSPAREDEDVWGGRRATFPSADARLWLERAVSRGFTAPTWPKAYGGGGLAADEARVLEEERVRIG